MISKFELKMTLKSSQCASVDFSENIILNWKCLCDVLRVWVPRSGRCSNAHASSSNIHLLKNFHGHFELIIFYSIHIYVVESKRGSLSWDPSRRDGSKDRDEGDHRLLDQAPGVSKGREGGGSCLRNVRYKSMCGKCLHTEAAGAWGQFILFFTVSLQLSAIDQSVQSLSHSRWQCYWVFNDR